MSEQELSGSGAPVYRYPNVRNEFTPAFGDGSNMEAICAHVERHIGKIDSVFHEVISDLVHIDVHWVKPSERFPFHTLFTTGMSDMPMNAPNEFDAYKYAELCVLLPPSWPIESTPFQLMDKVFSGEETYWPIRWLKIMARFPHEYKTWFARGHTLPNGEEAAPFARNTKLGCILLFPNISLPKGFHQLTINNEKTIHFYGMYPIYKEEMELKLKMGLDALFDKFDEFKVSDVVDVKRPNTCAKKGFWGLW